MTIALVFVYGLDVQRVGRQRRNTANKVRMDFDKETH